MRLCIVLALGLIASPVLAQEAIESRATFFETRIRPVLADRCFKCHGAKRAASGLRLDSREALHKGGKHGAAIVPGEPSSSLLVRAVRYEGERKMPPDKQLAAEVAADLERWIADGAFWPEAVAGKPTDAGEHWAFKPVQAVDPHLVDGFVQAKLLEHGMELNEPADKPTLLRRATFDLTGLPTTPQEIDAFLADESPQAFAKVVDRLLASPRYGERWGRHWLDLVRYTDEFENSWRYRDWVVKAFNADLPYDDFIRQQIAGDLLTAREPSCVNAEGIVATTMLSIGPWTGIDRKKRLTDIADDQIDIVSRTILGLTIACARCHDHKFDPITTADYYGLAGIFLSSHVIPQEGYLSHGVTRLRIPLVGDEEVKRHESQQAAIDESERRHRAAIERCYADFAQSLLSQTSRYLLAAWDYEHRPADDAQLSIDAFAARENLHAFAISQWIAYLKAQPLAEFQPLSVPERDFDGEPGVLAWRTRAERPWWSFNTNEHEVAIETFCLPARTVSINPGTEGGAVRWKSPIDGVVSITGRLSDADPLDGVGIVWAIDHLSNGVRRELSSGTCPNGSARLEEGSWSERLASVPVQPGDEILLQIRLRQGDAHYDITNVELVIAAIDGTAVWDLTRDLSEDFLAGNSSVWRFEDMAGSRRLQRMPAVDSLLGKICGAAAGREELEAAARALQQALDARAPNSAIADDLTGLRSPFWVNARDDAKYLSAEAQAELAQQAAELEVLKQSLPPLPYAHGVREGGLRHSLYPSMQDAPIHIRGSYEQLGERAPRRFPEVLARSTPTTIASGSGRAELAQWLVAADNPMTGRVLVNRLWQHHFGEGIVRTPSNFGILGDRPTHPELLDFLAARFVESGWSIKAMHRLMMLSSAYQQSSRASAATIQADPENRLFSRMNRQRLEAEAIHDALLTVAGQLYEKPGGSAEPASATNWRRMIYHQTLRTSRSGFGPLFDAANAAMHVERRTTSIAAPQDLYLMNDPEIAAAAVHLSQRREVVAETDASRRVGALYKLVCGRDPTQEEIKLGISFVAAAQDSSDPWPIYAQALLLSNEFLFVD